MNFKNKFLSHFIGDASAFEKSTLEEWKNDAASNISELKHMMGNPEEIEILQNYQDVNQKKAWENIQARTDLHIEKEAISFDFKKIAAIFVIVLAGIWGISYLSSKDIKNTVYMGVNTPKVKYSDGTLIDMDQSATLVENGFRTFSLKGRAYFKVAKDEKNPFTVHLQHGKVEVLGTEFNINTSSKKTDIWVSEGKIKVTFDNKDYFLTRNEQIVIEDNIILKSANIKISPDAWRNKVLKFENHSLKEVMQVIATYYDVALLWPASLKDDQCKIYTTFQNESIINVLKELEIISGLKYELNKKNTLIVKSYKC